MLKKQLKNANKSVTIKVTNVNQSCMVTTLIPIFGSEDFVGLRLSDQMMITPISNLIMVLMFMFEKNQLLADTNQPKIRCRLDSNSKTLKLDDLKEELDEKKEPLQSTKLL